MITVEWPTTFFYRVLTSTLYILHYKEGKLFVQNTLNEMLLKINKNEQRFCDHRQRTPFGQSARQRLTGTMLACVVKYPGHRRLRR